MRRTTRPCFTFLLALAAWLPACGGPYPDPPPTARRPVTDTIQGVAFTDDYRWLEDQDAPETRAWIAAETAYAEAVIGESPLRDTVRARLIALMDTPEIGNPTRGGAWEYFTLRRRGEELPTIVRRPAPSPDEPPIPIDPDHQYEVVIDPAPLSDRLTTRVEIVDVSNDGAFLIYAIRDGGADEVALRVRDLETNTDTDDVLPAALYSSVSFDEGGEGFYYAQRSRTEGPRLRYHRLGDDLAQDRELFGAGIGPRSFINVSHAEHGRYRIITVQQGWTSTDVWFQDLNRDPEPRPIIRDNGARNAARFRDGMLWVQTNDGAPNNRVVLVDPRQPSRDRWKEVLPEREAVLVGYSILEGKIYARYLEKVSTTIRVFELDGRPAGEIAVPDGFTASIRGGGEGHAILTLSAFDVPATEYRVDLATGDRVLWRAPWTQIDSTAIDVAQVWYDSKDGTSIPMYIVRRHDLALDGNRPTLLTGYGGFNVALTPGFSAVTAAWVGMGGVWARPNLRGGSEFGETWHRDGMLENKQNVFDDFLAAAEWLVDSGYTNPRRLAIRGASNGGLLMGAALTQRPDLFRAVLCGFPDLDMVRFYTFTDTNNMPALLEYGDAEIPEQFEFLRSYSPYQAVTDGVAYPAVMLMSGDRDTRVPPLQARRMTARLQAATSSHLPVILRYDDKQGHAAGRGRPFSLAVEDTAAELAFAMEMLGMSPN